MSNTQSISNLISRLPQLQREIIEQILIPKGAFQVRGGTIHMRFSEITYLPDVLPSGLKLPWLTYEVIGPYQIVVEANAQGGGQKKVKSYNTSIIKLFLQAAGANGGAWQGYEIKTHASKLDPFSTWNHPIWGNSVPDMEKEFLQETFPQGFVVADKRRIATITTAKPILYLFMLFYPTIGNQLISPIKVGRSGLRFKQIDLQLEANSEMDSILLEHDAIQWVRNLGKAQLQLLKNRVAPVVGNLAHELSVQTTADGIKNQLIKLCRRHSRQILSFKEEIGGEVPREAIAKSVLADAITTGILEPHKELGLLVGMAHEALFDGICTRVTIDAANNTRVQFMPTATPSEWYGYISANEHLPAVQALEALVEKLVPKFAGERFKVGNYQALTSLMKTSGRLKGLYEK